MNYLINYLIKLIHCYKEISLVNFKIEVNRISILDR